MPQDQDRQVSLEEFEEQRRTYYGLPKGLTESLKTQESGGRQYDRSGKVLTSLKHAKGRYQVLQSTADKYQLNADDPFENVEAGFRYLSDLHKQVDAKVTDPGERWAQTLAGYHAGEGRLRETNKTGNLPTTSDGLIRTDEYVAKIMDRWQKYDQGRSGQPATALTQEPPAQPTPLAKPVQQPAKPKRNATADLLNHDPIGYDKQGRPRSQVLWDLVRSFEDAKRKGQDLGAKELAGDIKRSFGDVMEVGVGTGGWPYVKPKRGSKFQYTMEDVAAVPVPDPDAELRQQEQRRRSEAFARKSTTEQASERLSDAFARGGGQVSKMARRGAGIIAGAVLAPQRNKLEYVDFPEWRRDEEERNRMLEDRRAARPSSFGWDVAEGIAEGVPTAAGALALGLLTGGSAPAVIGTGSAMGALGADWDQPGRAVTQTVLGGVAPYVGGRGGAAAAQRVAARLASPAAQATTRAAGEIVGGGAGNVLASGGEQLAFEGRIDPREAAKQFIVGSALSAPGAMAAAGRPAITAEPSGIEPNMLAAAAEPPVRAPQNVTVGARVMPRPARATIAPTAPDASQQSVLAYTRKVANIERAMPPGPERQTALDAARQEYLGARRGLLPEEAQAQLARPRIPFIQRRQLAVVDRDAEPSRYTAELPRVPQERRTAEIQRPAQPEAPQPDAPATRQLQEPDTGRRLIERTKAKAEELIEQGRFDDAINELKAHQRALKDAQTRAKGREGLRVQLERQIGQAGNRIGQVRKMKQQARNQPKAPQSAIDENAPTSDLPEARAPLFESVVNPEGGVPQSPESASGRFGALAREQAAQREAAAQPRRKATETLSPGEYLKRKTRGEGIRVSDRGEAALLGAKEAGIVGLANRGSKWTLSDAQVMLDEGGFMLPDGRRFTDPSVMENDVLTFLRDSGKQGRLDTSGIDRRLTDEEAEYYAWLEANEGQGETPPLQPPPSRIETPGSRRPRTERLPVPKATDDNIEQLRQRQEDLGRLAYDRRGNFTGDLRDEYNQLTAHIREYDNARAPAEIGPPLSGRSERMTPPTGEIPARRAALQPGTARFPEASRPGRKVTQEVQVPGGLRKAESFSSREDARQGHFERFDDQELVQEITRLEDVRNQAIRGRSKLTREEIEANNFDLKIAVEMQKERRRLQQQMGMEAGERIAPRTPGRVLRNAEAPRLPAPERPSVMERVMEAGNRATEREKAIDDFIEQRGEVGLMAPYDNGRDGRYVIVAPSTKPGKQGQWQATFFDNDGPIRDATYSDYRHMLSELGRLERMDISQALTSPETGQPQQSVAKPPETLAIANVPLKSVPGSVVSALKAVNAPDINRTRVELTGAEYALREIDKQNQPSIEKANDLIARAKAQATRNNWDWADVETIARREAGLDENWHTAKEAEEYARLQEIGGRKQRERVERESRYAGRVQELDVEVAARKQEAEALKAQKRATEEGQFRASRAEDERLQTEHVNELLGILKRDKSKGARDAWGAAIDAYLAGKTKKEREGAKLQLLVALDTNNEKALRSAVELYKQQPEASPTGAGRKIQHSQFGAVSEAPDQFGVRKGQLRVIDAQGKAHVIRNPRVAGNREAAFVKAEEMSIPSTALPELRRPDAPPAPLAKNKGTIMGSGFGSLQGMFDRGGKSPRASLPGGLNLAPDQSGVRAGFVRAISPTGKTQIVQAPRGYKAATAKPALAKSAMSTAPQEPTSGAPSSRDVGWFDYLRSPLSNLNYKGTYERIAGEAGKEVSEAFRRAQVAIAKDETSRGQQIAELDRTLRSYKTQLRAEGKPGLANWLDEHVAALHDPDAAFRGLAGFLKKFQYDWKLRHNPRSIIVNELQPLQTLWPHLTTREFLKVTAQARQKATRSRVAELAARESGGKVEEVDRGKKKWLPDVFSKVSESNRIMGHLAGELMADKMGLTGEAKARMAADWAKKVEFDNSRWDVPPLFRGRIASVLGQFKPFTIKNLERLYSDWKEAPMGSGSGNLARRAKMITSQLAIGGVRSVLVPGVKEIGGVLILGGLAKAFMKSGMEEEDANKMAEAVYFGAPGLVEQDLSSSVMLLDSPFGATPTEKIVNLFGGPTLSLIAKAWKEGETMATAKDADKTREEKIKASALRLGKAVSPYVKAGESLYSLATTGKPPKLRLGKEEVEMTKKEAIGYGLMGTPLRQTKFYEEEDAFDWQKRLLGQPQKPGRLNSFGDKLDAELRKHKLDYSRVDEMSGDTEATHKERSAKIESWLKDYGVRLIEHPRYALMTDVQQKTAIENLRRRIGTQSNLRRPDLTQFRPQEVLRSVRQSEREKPRRDREKIVVRP